MSIFVMGIVATIIVIAIAGSAYYFGQNQQKGSEPSITPTATSVPQESLSPTTLPTTTPKKLNSKSMVTENIEASVQTKNYAALEGYMANEVSVLLYATECCGMLSAKQATEQMSYLNGGTPPWDFSSNSATAQKLIAANPANFKGRIIGIAANGMVVSFNLNSENKIDKIFISADHKLIAP